MKKLLLSSLFVLLVWNANSETDLSGYRVYTRKIGTTSWTMLKDVGNVTSYNAIILNNTEICLTAYDFSLNESQRSIAIKYSVPPGKAKNVDLDKHQ